MNSEAIRIASDVKSKKEIAYDAIKEKILDYTFQPGAVLVERQLCALLDTSRTPIREALQLLASEGLVTNVPLKGSIVSEITYETISRIYDVREYIEGLATRLATQCATPEQAMQLKLYLDEMTRCIKSGENVTKLFATDSMLHRYLVICSRNDLLQNIYDNHLSAQIQRITLLTGKNFNQIANAHQYHIDIVEAVLSHDSETAEQKMREHIRKSKQTHLNMMAKKI